MTIFEFISVMVSIVLGLSFAQLLLTTSQFARNSTRVKFYLPHTMWLVNLVLWHFLLWWSFWDYRNVDWNYARFLVITLEPLVLFLTTSIATPRRFEAAIVDNKEYFFEIRKWFFLSFLVLQTLSIVDGPLVFGSEPWWIAYRIPQVLVAAVFLLGLFVPKGWAQHVSAWIVFLILLSASYFRFLPAAFE
jgi:hypothetical protein